MTRHTTTRRLLWTALVGSMLAAPLTLSASIQPEGRRGSHRERGGRGGGMRGILRDLDLTEEQRQQMRALREQGEQGTDRETFARAMERRRELNQAVETGADEGTLRQLAFELGEAEGETAIIRSRMHAQLMEILTPEQREQYQALRDEQEKKMAERRERMSQRRENRRNRNPDSF